MPPSTHPPVDFFTDAGNPRVARARATARLDLRARRDSQLLLALAIALPVVAMAGFSDGVERVLGLLGAAAFLGIQLWLTSLRSAPAWLPSARLALCLAFLGLANAWLDRSGSWSLTALAIPVVAVAAAHGGRAANAVAVAGIGLLLVPLALPGIGPGSRQEVLAVTMAAVVVALGSRRMIANLERSSARLRRASLRSRRQARQLAAVESVGGLLAREGPTPETLDRVIGVLEDAFGYRYPSIYIWNGKQLELGAQRNHRFPIETVPAGHGILGRVVRTREPVFLPDVRSDPDFLSVGPDVVSEIAVPLLSGPDVLGVLNVETSGEHRLDPDDFATMQIVGDRLAAALALGGERQKLAERAALLDRLTIFAIVLGASLDPATMDDEVASGAAHVIPADSVILVSDDATGAYLVNAVFGGDASLVGKPIEAGESVIGRSIASRAVVVDDRMRRARSTKATAKVKLPAALAAMAAPMVNGEDVLGAVTWLRDDPGSPFTAQEQEVAALLAGKVGSALANARLHQRTRDAAITDPLTGLHNRRHFDSALERGDALRRRVPAERRLQRSSILFDLDHFGQVNKRHGHQVGDRVLRLFAETLRTRARASDLVARFGGEEFVVILENASREDAMSIAEEVRTAFSRQHVETMRGQPLATTVSAGCAALEPWEVEGALLLERADMALALAKAGGRDQVVAA